MMKRSTLMLFAALSALLTITATTEAATSPAGQQKQVLSPTYTIDRIYRSMEGPSSLQKVYLGDPDHPELIWITGVRTEMVGEDGKTAQLPELMCHVNVDLDPLKHRAMLNMKRPIAARLITLSQGMLSAQLPRGYGFPIASNEALVLFTQVLNHNIAHPENVKVRHRVTFTYLRDRDLEQPLKPLFNLGASGSVLLDSPAAIATSMPGMSSGSMSTGSMSMGSMSMGSMSMGSTAMGGMGMGGAPGPAAVEAGGAHGASCLLLPRAPNAVSGGSDYTDPEGHKLTGHWVVPPGRQVNHSDITWFLALPYDTVMHYAAVHLHPFAESLTLRDLTTDETLFSAKAAGPRKGVGLTHVDSYASEKGIRLYKDHKYELISVYDNPTPETRDSMASIFLGLEDPEFEKPDPDTLEIRAADSLPLTTDTAVVFRTSAGDFGVQLFPEEAPAAARQFVRLVRSHAYDRAHVTRLVPGVSLQISPGAPLTPAQYAALAGPLASRLKPESGSLVICAGEAAFSIILNPAKAGDSCAVFGRIGPGAMVVGKAAGSGLDPAGAPKTDLRITRAEVFDTPAETAGLTLALPPAPGPGR